MAVEAYLPTIATVVVTALIDSINPCAIGVLILMISILLGKRKSMHDMLLYGGLYIFAVFLTYLLAGIGLTYALSTIPLFVTEYLSIGVGLLIVFAGLLEVKDFFWYGKGFSLQIPARFAAKIDRYAQNVTIPGVILVGMFVAAVELPCTGAPYLAIITLLSQYFDFTALLLLVLYNVIFVLPLIFILLAVAAGKRLSTFKKWKQDNRGTMRLFIGLMLIGMGWLLMLIANGTINFG
ncbi:MAG: GAP family protein [Candidatus Diapherotrites archaeon]|nr:GAP family protein [Candidatus Diapherotrites archaeon]